ncbi:hypothetical protein BCR44DRAFT_275774 [Catenaria anguillulae PL171]|uniref:Uncharacterized protein n=1 Tax=Catenaria anguillulae PL171 TaxID=765915 RepID=A0A1Y2HC20_9FUNG|nr:hypothetical protein BCR44DRAFT_275774 [Catenaria anguillulae PL171]
MFATDLRRYTSNRAIQSLVLPGLAATKLTAQPSVPVTPPVTARCATSAAAGSAETDTVAAADVSTPACHPFLAFLAISVPAFTCFPAFRYLVQVCLLPYLQLPTAALQRATACARRRHPTPQPPRCAACPDQTCNLTAALSHAPIEQGVSSRSIVL